LLRWSFLDIPQLRPKPLTYQGTSRLPRIAPVVSKNRPVQVVVRLSTLVMALNRPSGFRSPSMAVGNLASAGGATSTVELKKRKNNPQIKFYAVKIGHKPGVYLNWNECEENIAGYKNACCKYRVSGKSFRALINSCGYYF
jgi:Caulimovirus viroplasmin